MVFRVGEGLAPEQQIRAEQKVRQLAQQAPVRPLERAKKIVREIPPTIVDFFKPTPEVRARDVRLSTKKRHSSTLKQSGINTQTVAARNQH